MSAKTKFGVVICDRYRRCAGGKCFRALKNREGAFSIYAGKEVELVGYTTCDGCPGGNIEYAGDEKVKNGAEVIHLATGLLVGYPPCPYIHTFKGFLEARYDVKVVMGTHPIPQKYFEITHAWKPGKTWRGNCFSNRHWPMKRLVLLTIKEQFDQDCLIARNIQQYVIQSLLERIGKIREANIKHN